MPCQLEETHNADDAEKLQHLIVHAEDGEKDIQIEGHGGHKVNDVEQTPKEVELTRTDDQPDEKLEREPGITYALHVKKGLHVNTRVV